MYKVYLFIKNFRPYKESMKFRDEFCLPKNIDMSNPEHEIKVSMNDLLPHQVLKLFEIYPKLKNDMEILEEQYPGVKFRLIFKFGADESSGKLFSQVYH